MRSWKRTAIVLAASAIIGACASGNGPFQPSPFSGFPPTFTDATLSQYRTQYVADIARFRADPRGVMGSDAAGLACDLSPAQRRQFAADSFMLTPERRTPTWNEIHAQHDVKPTAPVVDRVEVKLLEGDCSGGTVNGRATLHARYLHIVPSTITNVYTVTEVELRETCDYRDLQRTGNCTRYQTHDVRAGFFGADQKLSVATDRPADEAVVFDYGAYDLDRDAGPGVTFAVMQSSFGDETNGATTRAGSADGRMRYEYLAGNRTNLVYTTRDGLLHGPVLLGGSTPGSCYENGERVLRDTCEVQ